MTTKRRPTGSTPRKKPKAKSKGKRKTSNGVSGSSFYDGKSLAQSWISNEDYGIIAGEAEGNMLKMATYLRQVLHKHAKELIERKAPTGRDSASRRTGR